MKQNNEIDALERVPFTVGHASKTRRDIFTCRELTPLDKANPIWAGKLTHRGAVGGSGEPGRSAEDLGRSTISTRKIVYSWAVMAVHDHYSKYRDTCIEEISRLGNLPQSVQ